MCAAMMVVVVTRFALRLGNALTARRKQGHRHQAAPWTPNSFPALKDPPWRVGSP